MCFPEAKIINLGTIESELVYPLISIGMMGKKNLKTIYDYNKYDYNNISKNVAKMANFRPKKARTPLLSQL